MATATVLAKTSGVKESKFGMSFFQRSQKRHSLEMHSLEDAVNHNTDELHTTVNHFRLSAVLALISVVAAVAVAATVVTTRPTHLSAANALVGSDDTVVKTGKHVESGSIMVLGTASFNSLLTLEKVAFIYHKPGDADVSQIGFAVTMVDRAHGITHVYGPDRSVRAGVCVCVCVCVHCCPGVRARRVYAHGCMRMGVCVYPASDTLSQPSLSPAYATYGRCSSPSRPPPRTTRMGASVPRKCRARSS